MASFDGAPEKLGNLLRHIRFEAFESGGQLLVGYPPLRTEQLAFEAGASARLRAIGKDFWHYLRPHAFGLGASAPLWKSHCPRDSASSDANELPTV